MKGKFAVVAVVLLIAGMASAQATDPILDPGNAPAFQGSVVPESQITPNEAYGTGYQETWLAGTGFNPLDPTAPWAYQIWLYYAKTTGSGTSNYGAPVELPNGAALHAMCAYVYDADATYNVEVDFYKYTYNIATNGNSSTPLAAVTSSGSPGYYNACYTLPSDETILHDTGNLRNSYIAIARMPTSTDARFRAIRLDWWRQISPAPATATFADVPTGYWAFQHIQALAASGITAGCGGGNFCPETTITRAQMAVFLSKALGLHWPQ